MPLIVFSVERKEVRKIKLILQSINDYLPKAEQGLESSLGGPPQLSLFSPTSDSTGSQPPLQKRTTWEL